MVTRRDELINAGRIKETLEYITGDKYILKTGGELIHRDNITWYLHIPAGKPGYISDLYEANGKLVLESTTLYETYKDMEHMYSENKYGQLREKLGDDVDRLQERSVRAKYRMMLPNVVRFFDKVDETLSKVNRDKGVRLLLVNYKGSVSLKHELDARNDSDIESRIENEISAMKEAVDLVVGWQVEERKRGLRMTQV